MQILASHRLTIQWVHKTNQWRSNLSSLLPNTYSSTIFALLCIRARNSLRIVQDLLKWWCNRSKLSSNMPSSKNKLRQLKLKLISKTREIIANRLQEMLKRNVKRQASSFCTSLITLLKRSRLEAKAKTKSRPKNNSNPHKLNFSLRVKCSVDLLQMQSMMAQKTQMTTQLWSLKMSWRRCKKSVNGRLLRIGNKKIRT